MRLSLILALLVAFVMILGGSGHLVFSRQYEVIVPDMLPERFVVLSTGILQIAIGLAALLPKLRRQAGLAFALLCIAYMPLHLWDFFRPDPIFPPVLAASARVIVQGLFIWAGLTLWRGTSASRSPEDRS